MAAGIALLVFVGIGVAQNEVVAENLDKLFNNKSSEADEEFNHFGIREEMIDANNEIDVTFHYENKTLTEVYCTTVMKQITVIFYLQQLINDKWVNVTSATVSKEDTDYRVQFVYASNPASGTYRTVASTMVEDYNGYAEATDGYSGDIDFVSPYT